MSGLYRAIAIVACTTICWSPASAASEPRQPTGKWLVEYGQDECLLSRGYGSEERPLILVIRKLPMDTDITISVLQPNQRKDEDGGNAKVSFGSGGPTKAGFLAYTMQASNLRYVMIGVEDGSSLITQAVGSGMISVNVPGEVTEVFSVPGFGAALKALDDCTLDLGRAWGFPVEQQQRLKKSARPDRLDYLQGSDYPAKELKNDENGQSQVRLTIDENGKPVDCIPLKSLKSATFAQTACRLLLRRAHFHPALDLDGKPMRGIFVYTITWVSNG